MVKQFIVFSHDIGQPLTEYVGGVKYMLNDAVWEAIVKYDVKQDDYVVDTLKTEFKGYD